MLLSLELAQVASFKTTTRLDELKEVNFVYGPNGTGKTTLSRVLGDPAKFPSCSQTWKSNPPNVVLVYNTDFVKANIAEAQDLPGVFTLGQTDVQLQRELEEARARLRGLLAKKDSLFQSKDDKGREAEELARDLANACWQAKKKHAEDFGPVFKGNLASKHVFLQQILAHRSTMAKTPSLHSLVQDVKVAYDSSSAPRSIISDINFAPLDEVESDPDIGEPIVAASTGFADLLRALGHHDWVLRGIDFEAESGSACPFCQQPMKESIWNDLRSCFDDAYKARLDRLKLKAQAYRGAVGQVEKLSYPEDLSEDDRVPLERAKTSLIAACERNREALDKKVNSPSMAVRIESTATEQETLKNIINNLNTAIVEHNERLKRKEQLRTSTATRVWGYLAGEELKAVLDAHHTQSSKIDKAVESIDKTLKKTENDIRSVERQIRVLESKTTSTRPTVDKINGLLRQFGFTTFQLAQSADETRYRIVRDDGQDARSTLSEGERTFVALLYFYFVAKENPNRTPRLICIDDPVSSLDSDVLFIVSTLVRDLIDIVKESNSQIIIATHNVYFFKEVTFSTRRSQLDSFGNETFWTLQKSPQGTAVRKHQKVPVRTSYELLWQELANKSPITLQNTMRRIVETYFTILSGVQPEEIWNKFTGSDKMICRSLFSWINDGSHGALDDVSLSLDASSVVTYLDVFQRMFSEMGHSAHYSAMSAKVGLTHAS